MTDEGDRTDAQTTQLPEILNLNRNNRSSQPVSDAIKFDMILDAAEGRVYIWSTQAKKERVMPVVLYREHQKVKNGWHSRIPSLHLAAFGPTPEAADESLQRVVRSFLLPFQRTGTLEQEMRNLGLGPTEDGLNFTLR